jgi:hypothetical protein
MKYITSNEIDGPIKRRLGLPDAKHRMLTTTKKE